MGRSLVIYYSRAGENYVAGDIVSLEVGNTEIAAKTAAEIAGADIFEVRPEREYSPNYSICCKEAKGETDEGARPPVAEYPDVEGYDTLIVCYPCWIGTMPMFMFTLLEGIPTAGKKILPLCTNEGSGMGKSESDIREACPDADVAYGLPVRGCEARSARPDIERWLRENGVV